MSDSCKKNYIDKTDLDNRKSVVNECWTLRMDGTRDQYAGGGLHSP